MKKAMKMIAGVLALGGLGYALFLIAPRDAAGKSGASDVVEVERGTIVDKALATGQIVPEQEIQVKSQISGIVKTCFVQVGDRVKAGDRLFEILPDPTPLEVTEAQRNVELVEVSYRQARTNLERYKNLLDSGVLARDKYDAQMQVHDREQIQLDLARERLTLLREGKLAPRSGRGAIDSIIRAPASGTVLERHVNPGDPVVPLTTFQAGTALMTLADMSSLLFKGTVDEIDVGKLAIGQRVRIQIGAVPDAEIGGNLTRIAPKAREKEGSTLFDVEVEITDRDGILLRAGYSANSDIIIQEKKNVLLVPERLVIFDGEQAFVEFPADSPDGEPVRHEITVGLSDGLQVEVVAGLDEGSHIVERAPRTIE